MKEVEKIEQIVKKTLREARKSRGYTLQYASDQLNVNIKTLWSWEHGLTFPNTKKIKMLEALYGYSYDDIIFLSKITV